MKVKSRSNPKSKCGYITFKIKFNYLVGEKQKGEDIIFSILLLLLRDTLESIFLYKAPKDHKLLFLIHTEPVF